MTRLMTRTVLAAVAVLSVAAIPNTAKADRFDIRVGGCQPPARRVWVEPVYEERRVQVWIEPQYRTVTEPVYVRGYFKTVCDRVYVQPVFECREVVRFDHFGRRIVTSERVCVRQGGWQTVERQEWVEPHTRNETRQVLVCAGHFETRCQRVCVREGHWATVPGHHNHGVGFSVTLGR